MTEDMLAVNRILVAFIVFVLVLIRIGCIVLFAPFFASDLFPTQIRIYLIGVFSFIMVPFAAMTAAIPRNLDMLQLGLLAGQEFALGMALGIFATMVFTGVQLAGELAGQQIGFSMANVLDPTTGEESPILGYINMNLAMMLFIIAGLHLVYIYIVFQSYQFIGIGSLLPEAAFDPLLRMSLEQARALLVVGLELAIPVMLIMLMNSVVEGFITKTMPQMNIMVLGMPLRVVLGLSALIFIYPAICQALMPPDWRFNLSVMPEGALGGMLDDLSFMVRELGGQ